MWKLTIEDDEQKQISLQLAHEEYSVGRDESNAIRLTDRNISRKHALLARNGQGWLLKDLASYNGTFMNGERVAEGVHVGHGDVVQLGDYRLELHDESKQVVPTAQQQVQLPPHHRPDRLVVVVGPQPGQEFFLDRDHFTLGRSEDADVSVNHSSVSRFHAELFAVGNGRFEIIDKGSANGLRINGQEVRRGFLEAGDALEMGDVRLRFVGAGKIFRAGFDTRQMLPAVTGLDGAIGGARVTAAGQQTSSIMKMVGVGAVLGILGVGATAAYITWKSPPAQGSAQPTSAAAPEDPGQKLLAEAKSLAEAGDLAGAHKKISEIDAGSPSLNDPAVADIEGRWADGVVTEAEKITDDPGKQVELLWKVATTPTVDETRRKKAAEMIKTIDPTIEVPTDAKPGVAPPQLPPRPPPTSKPATSSAKGPDGTDRKALDDPKGKINELLGRIDKLSERELSLLIALCVQEGNAACRNRAAGKLKELQSQNPP